MAEGIHEQIVGKDNLSGAANYWSMVMSLRPYVFQVISYLLTHISCFHLAILVWRDYLSEMSRIWFISSSGFGQSRCTELDEE